MINIKFCLYIIKFNMLVFTIIANKISTFFVLESFVTVSKFIKEGNKYFGEIKIKLASKGSIKLLQSFLVTFVLNMSQDYN